MLMKHLTIALKRQMFADFFVFVSKDSFILIDQQQWCKQHLFSF